mgnify:FL=1
MVKKGVDLLRKKEKRNMADRCTECGLSSPNHRIGCDVIEAPKVEEKVAKEVKKSNKKTTSKKKATKKA